MSLVGSEIHATTESSRLGSYVGISGDGLTVAVSGYENTTWVSNPVRVYDWSETEWVQRGAIVVAGDADENATNDVRSMAFSEAANAVAVGTYHNVTQRTALYVYLWDTAAWQTRIVVDDVLDESFASEVCISNDATFVAAGNPSGSGIVTLYRWSGSSYILTFTYYGQEVDGCAGSSMAMTPTGSVLAIASKGAPGTVECCVLSDGIVQYSDTITDSNALQVDVSISSSGSFVAVGSSDNGESGTVTVFLIGEGIQQRGQQLRGNNPTMQALGLAVALSGDGLTMIAASRGASNVGQVHVYAYVNSLWIVQGVLPAPGAQFSFGGSLALSSTGEFAAVGEPWTSSFGASNGGAVRVFNTVFNITPDPADGIPATISWSESASIEGTAEGAHYGTYLDIDTGGNVLLASNAGVSALADVSVLDYDSATGVWQPRENTFPGEEPSMQLIVLSADGLVAVAVCDLGEDIGFFYRFVWTDEAWAQSGTSQDLDFTNGFLRISGDGSVLAISEFGYGNGFQGRLRVFRWADDTWVQMATAFEGNPPLEVFDQDPRAADWLGVDTQVSGTRVAFSQIASHQASVYDFDAEENAWILVGHVIALRNHENDTMFRFALGLAGDRLVVAEQGYNLFDSSPAVGSITVYLFAANVWTVSATLASGLVFPPWFDMLCVSADGNVVVAASVAEDETVSVVSYVWQPEARDPTWNTYDVALGTAADNMTLSSDGTTVALAETSLNAGAGRVTTYRREVVYDSPVVDGNIAWGPVGHGISGSFSGHYLGTHLNLNDTGDTFMAAGATYSLLQYVYVIERADGTWLSRIPLTVGDDPSVEFRVLDVQMASSGLVVVALVNVVVQDVIEATSVIRFQWDESGWVISGEPQMTLVESADDVSILRISGDGTRLAISEPLAVDGRGRIRVYDWTESQWVQIGDTFVGDAPITAWPDGDIRNSDALGLSMTLAHDGTRIAFSQVASHQVSVYNLEDGAWVVAGVLPQVNHEGTTVFLFPVHMSIAHLVVAELGVQMDQNEDAIGGSLRLYALVNNTWTLQRVFLPDSTFANMPWSSTVAISQDGNVILVATVDSENLQTVRTFIWQPQARAPAWNEYIVAANSTVDSMALSPDGTTVALGNSVANDNTGAVTVYRRDGGSAIPCFHGDTIIALADGTVVRVADMAAGMVVRDIHGRAQAVRRVIRRQQADCVYFQPDALAPGVPNRTLLVTPNHLLRHPDGRVMPAGALVAALEEMQTRRAVRVRAGGARVMHRSAARCGRILQPLTVYHIAVDRWSLVRVHNLWAETMVQTVADDRRRRQCVRQ